MARKYRKLGLRRDKNLADVDNKYEALSNVLNGLAGPGETFLPEDIAVINNLRNTNVTSTDFAQVKGLKLTYLDKDDNNTEKTLTPLVKLEDRLENYKVVTGSPPYLVGGDGLKAKFIPSRNIADNILATTTGSQLIKDANDVVGPLMFWNNGTFEFQNLIYPDFQDSYGMVQWEGYFAPAPGDLAITILYYTSGLLLIEQDPFDTGSWETLKSIYNSTRSLTITSAQAQTGVTTFSVGNNAKYINIGDKISHPTLEVYVTDVNLSAGTINVDTPIDLQAGNNTLVFSFDMGQQEVQGFFRLRNSYTNDKIKIRISVWWPDPNNENVFYSIKRLRLYYPNSVINAGNDDALTFNLLYSSFNRIYETEKLSIEYFVNNYLSPTNDKTQNDITVNSGIYVRYTAPLLPTDRFYNTTLQTFTYTGIGKIEKSNAFTNVKSGDYVIRKSNYVKTYLIKEKESSGIIYISPNNDIVTNPGDTFTGYTVDSQGLVGVYNISNSSGQLRLLPLTNQDFHISLVKDDQLVVTIDNATDTITGFFRVGTYDFKTGNISLQTVVNTGQTPSTNGIAVVYRSSSLEDLSKLNYCYGVLGKEVTTIVPAGTSKIYLKDTNGLAIDMYVQLSGYFSTNAKVASISSDVGGSFITTTNPALLQIDKDVTLTFSPDNVNRELCVIPLNTAPPFAGTDAGLITQSGYESLSVNRLTTDKITLKGSTIASTVPTDLTVTKSVQFTAANGDTYRFLIR